MSPCDFQIDKMDSCFFPAILTQRTGVAKIDTAGQTFLKNLLKLGGRVCLPAIEPQNKNVCGGDGKQAVQLFGILSR
jgi:hypothetical protein